MLMHRREPPRQLPMPPRPRRLTSGQGPTLPVGNVPRVRLVAGCGRRRARPLYRREPLRANGFWFAPVGSIRTCDGADRRGAAALVAPDRAVDDRSGRRHRHHRGRRRGVCIDQRLGEHEGDRRVEGRPAKQPEPEPPPPPKQSPEPPPPEPPPPPPVVETVTEAPPPPPEPTPTTTQPPITTTRTTPTTSPTTTTTSPTTTTTSPTTTTKRRRLLHR